jgi:hypothetical protein
MIVCLLAIGKYAQADEYDDMFESAMQDEESAQEAEGEKSQGGNDLERGFCLSLSGEHTSSLRKGILEDYTDFAGDFKSPQVINTVGIEVRQNDLHVVSNWENKIIMNREGEWQEMLSLSPLENYLMWTPAGFTLRFGFQNFNWGTADRINPSDNLNPRDYSLSPRAEIIPVFALSLAYFPATEVALELVYIPFDQQDILPVDSEAQLQAQFPASTVGVKQPAYDFSSFVVGVRCSFYLQYLDFSFSYIYNFDAFDTPDIGLVDLGGLYGVSAIELKKTRVHQFGCDFRTAIESVGIWGELCFELQDVYVPESYTVRPPVLSWAAGCDFSYGPEDEHYLNIQYIGQYVFDYDTSYFKDYANGQPALGQSEEYYREFYYRSLLFELASLQEALLQGVALNLEWSFADSLVNPCLQVVYLFPLLYEQKTLANGTAVDYMRLGSLMLNAELDVMPFDSFHLIMGCDLYLSWHGIGDNDITLNHASQVGSFIENSSLYFKMRYTWGVEIEKGR